LDFGDNHGSNRMNSRAMARDTPSIADIVFRAWFCPNSKVPEMNQRVASMRIRLILLALLLLVLWAARSTHP